MATYYGSRCRAHQVFRRVDKQVSKRILSRVDPVHVDRVMAVIIADVEVPVAVLPLGALLAAKRSLAHLQYRPDGPRDDDVAVAVDKFHGKK